MARVITFSRTFPAYHQRAGHPTYFVEGLWHSMFVDFNFKEGVMPALGMNLEVGEYKPKRHTIRAGNRWKVGDKFSPRVWSGKPYNSKQIVIAPDIEIKKVWDVTVELIETPTPSGKYSTAGYKFKVNGEVVSTEVLAENDGLEYDDFKDWFGIHKAMDKLRLKRKLFEGQIICWDESVSY